MDAEEWRQSPSYPDYEVSDQGRVRRCTPAPHTHVGRICKPYTLPPDEQLRVHLSTGGKAKSCMVSRLVAETFVGKRDPIHSLIWVKHLDGNPKNNVASNLKWAKPGECREGKKLTEANVADILYELNNYNARGVVAALASRYDVTSSLICQIASGAVWSHVKARPEFRPRPDSSSTLSERGNAIAKYMSHKQQGD